MRKIQIAIIITCFGLASCKKNDVIFTEPQPNNIKNISEFPQKALGNYINPELNYKLNVENDLITRIFYDIDTVSSSELQNYNQNEFKLLTKLSDTVYIAEFNLIDTLFNLKNGDILRKIKQNYFLNKKNSDANWNVSKINFFSNYLIISSIENESEIALLDEITHQTNVDSTFQKTYSLNKKQFKEFVKKNGFKGNEIYIKQ